MYILIILKVYKHELTNSIYFFCMTTTSKYIELSHSILYTNKGIIWLKPRRHKNKYIKQNNKIATTAFQKDTINNTLTLISMRKNTLQL